MRVTFLVLAHDEPPQLVRLLRRILDAPGDRAVVHVDAASDVAPFAAALETAGLRDRVQLPASRFNIRWGDFAVVRATIEALRTAVALEPADSYVLLSAADYPIRPIVSLRDELRRGAVHMASAPMPDVEHEKPLSRLEHFYIGAKDRGSMRAGAVNKVLRRLPPRNVGRGLEGLTPYGGSQWWAMPDSVARSVLTYIDQHPRTVRFFSRTLNPDEMFFQTMVRAVASDVPLRDELTWADWSRPVPPGSPATLVDGDLELVRAAAGRYWFARKFDAHRSGRLLDEIDAALLSKS